MFKYSKLPLIELQSCWFITIWLNGVATTICRNAEEYAQFGISWELMQKAAHCK